MTHVKKTKDGSNEYDPIFVLKHEALYEGLREYFMSLMLKEQVHATVNLLAFALTSAILKTNIHCAIGYCASPTLIKVQTRPIGSILNSMPTTGMHWWLWITDVNKKKFYVLVPINKLPENIPDSRKKLNKFVGLIISQMRVYAGGNH
ncbi:hypothetical protein Ahy_A01g002367 [Arachis hypogaea]|uniref:Ubiquitin-like protease family profile domain-containing protein n=1 Tax=Arachis hypogaea TaxID=3818 RepID=A0A445EQK8_ARAHY|nr:hypothetical protein Ahy_A01g002367 [Arachis hypogaea]